MNRAVAIASSAFVALWATGGPGSAVSIAQTVPPAASSPKPSASLDAETQAQIDQFQERRLIFEAPSPAASATPDPQLYSLRQGPETIYDVDFVELMNDPSLTNFWLAERNRDYTYWIGTGLVGVPLGSVLFLQNFQGQGASAVFANPQHAQGANAADWRTFTLSVVGLSAALYGAYNLGLWALEELDQRHPNRLDADSIAPRVREWNDQLGESLGLTPQQWPSPPTPRPSVSPSGSPVPGANPFSAPSAPVEGPGAYPGGAPPTAVPFPLPMLSPGATLAPPATPSPKPRPSVLNFPNSPREQATSQPSPAASPKAATPKPASPKATVTPGPRRS